MSTETVDPWHAMLSQQVADSAGAHSSLDQRRQSASELFQQSGFPTRKHEEWRYTPLKSVAQGEYSALLPADGALPGDDELATTSDIRIVLINGRFRDDLSDLTALPDEVSIRGLAGMLAENPDSVIESIDRLIPSEDHPFQNLADVFLCDGLVIDAQGETDARIHIVHAQDGSTVSGSSHVSGLVRLSGGAKIEILEEFRSRGTTLANIRWGMEIGSGCEFSRQRVVRPGCDVLYHGTRVQVEGKAIFRDLIAGSGARLVRNEIHAILAGPEGHVDLLGGYVSNGDEIVDHHTVIEHAVEDCTSREIYRGVLGGGSRGAFTGMIHVHQDAQRTDAEQSNDAILLSRSAEMNTRPRLEIYADDVKCTHGATVGELDDESLFYLRSRGVGLEEARRMLVRAFTAEVFKDLENEALKEQFIEQLQEAMPAAGESGS